MIEFLARKESLPKEEDRNIEQMLPNLRIRNWSLDSLKEIIWRIQGYFIRS